MYLYLHSTILQCVINHLARIYIVLTCVTSHFVQVSTKSKHLIITHIYIYISLGRDVKQL